MILSLVFVAYFAMADSPAPEQPARDKCLAALGRFEFGENPNVPLSWKGEKFPPFIHEKFKDEHFVWTGRKIYRTKKDVVFISSEATLRLNYHGIEIWDAQKSLLDQDLKWSDLRQIQRSFLQPSFERLISSHVTASTAKRLANYMKDCEELHTDFKKTGRPIADEAFDRRTQLEKLYHFGDAAKDEAIYQDGDQ